MFFDLATVGFTAGQEGQPIGVAQEQYWRLITGGFLHDGFIHIGFNMYILYWLGTMLEPALGHVRFTALYFASLLAGSFGAIVADPNVLTVGASGAVFGLMAAAFVFQRARGIDPWRSGLGPVILLNLALPFIFTEPEHLDRRAHRRPGRRRDRGAGDRAARGDAARRPAARARVRGGRPSCRSPARSPSRTPRRPSSASDRLSY